MKSSRRDIIFSQNYLKLLVQFDFRRTIISRTPHLVHNGLDRSTNKIREHAQHDVFRVQSVVKKGHFKPPTFI